MLEGGHAMNALPQVAKALVNCRVLPGESIEEVRKTLVRVMDDERISVKTAWEPTLSPPSPLTPEIMATIEKLSAEFWPGTVVVPIMQPGGTDGSHLRNAGIPTYGHSGLAAEVTENRAHGKDERVQVKSFYEGQEYLYRLVKMLAGGK
jgi:acetylornithine deacetylase/succinyl-diaminopimelate desuccinylase-like protein